MSPSIILSSFSLSDIVKRWFYGINNDISFRKEDDCIVITGIKGEISKLDSDKQIEELNKIFYGLYKKNVVIEKKSSISLQKELLIEHKKNILNLDNDEYKELDGLSDGVRLSLK